MKTDRYDFHFRGGTLDTTDYTIILQPDPNGPASPSTFSMLYSNMSADIADQGPSKATVRKREDDVIFFEVKRIRTDEFTNYTDLNISSENLTEMDRAGMRALMEERNFTCN